MQINIENLIPMTEANQNFSKVARMVDNKGTVVILKNNKPKYVLVDYDSIISEEKAEKTIVSQDTVDEVANSILVRHLDAFKELAK